MKIPPSNSSDIFRDFEQLGWQSVAEQYRDAFANLTPQAVGPLLDAVGVRAGIRLLDVASGPGFAAAEAARRAASTVGIDFSAAMVSRAQREHPNVKFLVGDADHLPFRSEMFDAAVMNFGLLHLARPEIALHEMQQVLRHGGRVAFTVWAEPNETVGFQIILRAIEAHGRVDVPLPAGPPFFRFSDPEESSKTLQAAGFTNPTVVKLQQVWRLPSGDALFRAMEGATVRTRGLLRAQTPEALVQIRQAVNQAARAYEKQGSIQLPMPAMLATAVKP